VPGENTVLLEGVRLVFRNFAGKEGKYNREGDRNFGVIIPNETEEQQRIVEQLIADGWNVKYLKPREGDDVDETDEPTETPWLSVKVGYGKGRPPQIYLVTQGGRKRTPLDETTVSELDWADITNVDLIVRPYHYDVSGRQGISAYVQSMYVSIEEDPLRAKYEAMDDQEA
jgi:hypothetical protein